MVILCLLSTLDHVSICRPYLFELLLSMGEVKSIVFVERPTAREDMTERIIKAVASISPEEILSSV